MIINFSKIFPTSRFKVSCFVVLFEHLIFLMPHNLLRGCSCVLLLLLLIGCSTPYKDKQYDYNLQSYNATCPQIQQRMQQLEYRKQNVRNNDRFRFKYMMVIPGFIEMFRMNKEEKRIEEEFYHLRGLLIEKHCNNSPSTSSKDKGYNNMVNQPKMQNNRTPYKHRYRPEYMDYYQEYYGGN